MVVFPYGQNPPGPDGAFRAAKQRQKEPSVRCRHLADNDVSKSFHKNVCKAPAKVTDTGTVEMKDGKNVLTATKIDLAD